MGQGRAGQGRAGQGRAGLGRAGQGWNRLACTGTKEEIRAEQSRAEQHKTLT